MNARPATAPLEGPLRRGIGINERPPFAGKGGAHHQGRQIPPREKMHAIVERQTKRNFPQKGNAPSRKPKKLPREKEGAHYKRRTSGETFLLRKIRAVCVGGAIVEFFWFVAAPRFS